LKVIDKVIENCQALLTIEVEPERVQQALQQTARALSRSVRVRGFRPGRAPYVLIARAVGEERLFDQALEQLGPKIYDEALAAEGIEAYAPGHIQVEQRDPLIMKATVPLPPVVELGDYQSIRRTPKPVVVSEEMVDQALADLQHENVEVVPVERPAALGDELLADVRSTMDGEVLSDQSGVTFTLSDEALPRVPPGFSAHLVGASAGETRTFTLTYPQDHEDQQLAGQAVTFEVAIHAVKERQLPALDDEFAQTLGVETLDALREQVRSQLEARLQREADASLRDELLAELIALSRVEFPPQLLEAEVNRMIESRRERLRGAGLTLEKYLEMQGQTLEEFKEGLRPSAREFVVRSLVLTKLVEQENIQLEPGEAEREGLPAEQLLTRKALDRLAELATGRTTSPEESTE